MKIFLLSALGTMLLSCNNSGQNQTLDTNSEVDTSTNDTETSLGPVPPNTSDWVTVNAGSFVFGSPDDAPCRAAYREERVNVTLTHDFLMATTEVTQKQWNDMALRMPAQDVVEDELPVVFINFYEAAAFLNALSQKEGFEQCYDLSSCEGQIGSGCPYVSADVRNCRCTEDDCSDQPTIYHCADDIHVYDNWYECPGYRLPTTAEWEYAAKAGTITHTYNGDLLPNPRDICQNQPNLNEIAWYCHNSNDALHPVATKHPNAWGLYDILGNAYEWVDYFTDGYSLDRMERTPGEDLVDPMGPKEGYRKDLRGGHFHRDGCYTRASWQSAEEPTNRRIDASLRPVRTLFE